MHTADIQHRLEQTLARYVAMPTVPSDIAACSDAITHLETELQTIGMYTYRSGANHPWVVAATSPQALLKKHIKILFAVHFDIVPPNHESQLQLEVTADKLIGRGVYDMKFAAACVIELLRDLANEGTLHNYDIGILFTTDEEKGGYDGALDFLQQGWRCDVAMLGDGGDSWQLEGRAKSFAYLYLHAQGKSAHSSRPWEGDNPVYRLSAAVHEIGERFAANTADQVTVSVNALKSSKAHVPNTTRIPDKARAGVSIRAFTEQEADLAMTEIAHIAKKHDLAIEQTIGESPVYLMKDNPLVQTFIKLMEDVHGKPIEIVDAYGASDARHFAPFGIATLLMYLDGGGFHGHDEWIRRSDLYKFYDLVRRFVEAEARIPAHKHQQTTHIPV